ncbi:DUF4227 family protein [Oceanobacillus sp. FSL W8-0428]|uniref:Membrane protein YqzK n=1 Tax=Oceanobacillus sojae TaxID=582851 RepID=A0A511ZDA0_9BACI|nr:DUF4227 family protein [Oceanobacillus sojae]GEN85426.1 hypothetical protein OSO01_01650 [Oceanobacillus sojae]
MEKHFKEAVKIFIWFMIGACFFTVCLHYIYNEFQEMHRYDSPEGPAVKVIYEEAGWFPFDILKGE